MADDAERCPDCQTEPGAPHLIGCDVARCPVCGIQQLQCRAHEFVEVFSIWTGHWPGKAECEREDWWCFWDDRNGWTPCSSSHPGALHDLNRLGTEAAYGRLVWDRAAQQFARPT